LCGPTPTALLCGPTPTTAAPESGTTGCLLMGGVDDGVIPAHVRLFVDLPVVDHPIMLANCVVDAPGVYDVVESLVDSLDDAPKDDPGDTTQHTRRVI
jgi:hypothetical protein